MTLKAILNAMNHGHIWMAGSVFVRQYQRRIEIVSPGGLPPGITYENILWEQSPRNRRLAVAFSHAGLVERAGQGMNLIYESCIRESKAVPDFSRSDPSHVWVTLRGELRNPEFLGVLERIGKERVDTFSTEELLAVDQVFTGAGIDERIKPYIDTLVDEGFIERTNLSKPAYVLSRRLYAVVRKSGVYTRMEEFLQVLPAMVLA